MKIAFVNYYQGGIERGAEVFVDELSRNFKEQGHSVKIYTYKAKQKRRWKFLWRLYLDPHGISICFFTFRQLHSLWSSNYDVIIPMNSGWQVVWIRMLTWLKGTKMLVSGQSGIGWDDRVNLMLQPDVFIGTSQKAKVWAKKFLPFIRSEYVPNGVDTKMFTQNGEKYRHNLKGKVVLCVSSLVKSKRIDLVIRAVSNLKGISLLIVGDGPLKNELGDLALALMGNNQEFLVVNHTQMPMVYRSADLLVFVPEKSESFGIVLVEAMSCGLPIVTIDDEVRREIVGRAGKYIDDPTDELRFAKVIDNALQAKSDKVTRNIANKYDWKNVANMYLDIIKTL